MTTEAGREPGLLDCVKGQLLTPESSGQDLQTNQTESVTSGIMLLPTFKVLSLASHHQHPLRHS